VLKAVCQGAGGKRRVYTMNDYMKRALAL